MSAYPPIQAALFCGVGFIAAAVNACGRFPGQPPVIQLERIVPDETVPLDQFGTFTPSVSRGCKFVSVTSNHQVYVFDRRKRRFLLASAAPSGEPATYSSHGGLLPGGGRLSEDGGRVAFTSMADNLVAGGSRLRDQVYVRDLGLGEVWRVSQSGAGEPGNAASRFIRLSGDGTVVAFVSAATNLVEDDTNGAEDVFVHYLHSRETVRVSVTSIGEQADGASYGPSLSRDGRFVAFASEATNLAARDTNGVADVFVRDAVEGRTERISLAAGGRETSAPSDAPAITAQGRFVAFSSESDDIVLGDHNGERDVFLHDRSTGRTVLASVVAGDGGANGPSDNPVASEDGSQVAFVSRASNLVEGDRNEHPDVFVRHLVRGDTVRLSVGAGGLEANEESGAFGVAMSPDGSCVAFDSYASNLVPEDGDGIVDVFIRHLR
jgi:Tol biopolymer transport system component